MKSHWGKRLLGFGFIASLCFLQGCVNLGPTGGHRGQFIVTLTSVSPSSVTAGGPPFILTVNGSNLTGGFATLVWNGGQQIASVGAGHSTQSTQATFLIDASLIANPGNVSIAVVDGINSNLVSNTLTLTVMPHTTTACALFGLYHYLVTGFEQKGSMVAAGAFGVDASGNVTGEYGFGDPLSFSLFGNTPDFIGPGFPGPAGGQCTNSSTPNEGTLTLSCACGVPSGTTFTFTYTFILQQGGGGRLVESNDAVAPFGNLSGSGVFAKVIPDSVFNGDYAMGMVGTDTHGDQGLWTHFGAVGAFTFSNGNLNGVADVNDGGTVLSNAMLGPAPGVALFSPDAYSIDQVNLSLTGLGNNFVFHMLMTSPATGFVVGNVNSLFAPSGTFEGVILAGFVSSQANPGGYGNNSLNAPLVLSILGAPPPLCCTTSTDTTLGLASGFNSGAGTFNLQLDNVSGGVANLNQAVTGATYSVASNGRTTVSYSVGGNTLNYIYYLDSVNDGYILGLGNSAEFGSFQPQAAGPFTTASINGTFGSATFFPLTPVAPNLATEITLSNGSVSANAPAGALTGTYTVAPSGRGTASVNLPVLGGKDLVFYVLGAGSVVAMGSDNTMTDAITFMHF